MGTKPILKRLRQEALFPVEEIAAYLGVDEKEYLRLEKDAARLSREQLERQAELYHVEEYDILTGTALNLNTNKMLRTMHETEKMNVIIAGSRSFDDYRKLEEVCDNILKDIAADKDITIFSGGAKGADNLGERYAQEREYNLKRFPADWKRYGRKAGPIRNCLMAQEADMAIIFWDGLSKGAKSMISIARKEGLILHLISF